MTKKEIKSIFSEIELQFKCLQKAEKKMRYGLGTLVLLFIGIFQLQVLAIPFPHWETVVICTICLIFINLLFLLLVFLGYVFLKARHNKEVEVVYGQILEFPMIGDVPSVPDAIAESLADFMHVDVLSAEEKDRLLWRVKNFKK